MNRYIIEFKGTKRGETVEGNVHVNASSYKDAEHYIDEYLIENKITPKSFTLIKKEPLKGSVVGSKITYTEINRK